MSARTVRKSATGSPAAGKGGTTPPEPGFPVTVELLAWVNEFAGGSGSGTMELHEHALPGERIRNFLDRFSRRHPRLHEVLWDPDTGELGPHIEIIVNEAVLGVEHELDSSLRAGDRLSLLGQYIGG